MTTIGGRFTLEAPLGRGATSHVWSAFDSRLHRPVVLKQLRFPTPIARRRFQREARLLARLNHPGVPAVYDLGDDYIAMELVPGRPLQEVIAELAPLPPSWCAAVGVQLAAVLACLHRVNLVHRDIKPSNIVLMASGAIKLVDFGLSIVLDDSSTSRLTPPDVVVGSSDYRAPECLHRDADARSDIYSLGRVLTDLGLTAPMGLTAADPSSRPASALDVIELLRPLLGPVAALPVFVPDPSLVLPLTDAYAALALPPAPTTPAPVVTSPRSARASAEHLAANDRYDEAIALLDAAIATTEPSDPSVLDLRRDLTRLLIEVGDTTRAAQECETLIPLLRQRLGPEHAAVQQALAWQTSMGATERGPRPRSRS